MARVGTVPGDTVTAPGGGPPAADAGSATLVLKNVALLDGRQVDVRVADRSIGEIAPAGTLAGVGESMDLRGFLLLPAPAEPHAHYDTALLRDRAPNPSGELESAVRAWEAIASDASRQDFIDRATEVARMAIRNGATAVRTHVGIYPTVALRAVEALLEVRERVAEWLDLQIVALTVDWTGQESRRLRSWVEEAIRLGVDVLGGCPHLDDDPITCIDDYLGLAAESERLVDLHMDEQLDPKVDNLPYLAERVRLLGLRDRVTASHCVSLGVQPIEQSMRTAAELADAGVVVVCNPQTNLYLQGRREATAKHRGLTAIQPLLEAGVVLAGGGDNVQDPFNRMGRADPLETASLLVTAGQLDPKMAYRAVSTGARAAMCLPEVRVATGFPAELLALRADSLGQALADPTDRLVIHHGRVVSRTIVTRQGP